MSKTSNAMDQSTARKLLEEGGFLLFLGVPQGTEFGIDMKSWNTGEKFRGVKMIPPGLHYIFYSAVNSTDDVAPRSGFFHNFKKSEVVVKKWDAKKEDISTEAVCDAEIISLKHNMLALDGFLGPYPYDIWNKWKDMTPNINEHLVNRIIPLSGLVRSALELQACSDGDRPRGVAKISLDPNTPSSSNIMKKTRLSDNNEEDFLPDLKPIEGTALRLTEFPKKSYPDGATAAEMTKHSLDSTYVLDTQIQKYTESTGIIGEMEICFVCFLVGHSLEAFEQWKKLVILFCSSDVAIQKYRKLYDLFISSLEIHIKEIPEEFIADIVSNKNFVYVHLRNLFRNIQNSNVDGQFKTKVERFRDNLTKTYLWDFGHLDSEEEDEAPTIVEV